jgi:hypothetical protein
MLETGIWLGAESGEGRKNTLRWKQTYKGTLDLERDLDWC